MPQQILRSVRYDDTSASAPGGDRRVTFVVNGGFVNFDAAVSTIRLQSSQPALPDRQRTEAGAFQFSEGPRLAVRARNHVFVAAAERLQVYWGTYILSERIRGLRRETSKLSASTPPGLPASFRGEGREYKAYPSLSRARWLFPAGRSGIRRAGIRGLFRPSTLKGRALRALVLAGVFPGQSVPLGRDALVALEDELAGVLDERGVEIAFYLGVPGAYRKVTAQVMTPEGETLAFAKIATSPVTQELVERERRVLLRLRESEGLRGRVPEVLHAFDWVGNSVLLITGGPDRPGPKRLSYAHLDLCTNVFLPFARGGTFGESAMAARMSETLSRVGTRLPTPLFDRLDHALGRLREELGSVRLPLSLCHRDFAPWNTRVGPRGLFVFDWDGAQEGTTPLYDLFHFHAIQAALFDKRDPLPDRSLLRRSLDELWPEGHGYLPPLYLAYLLDMSLFYGEARVAVPDAGEDRVWSWFCDQVEVYLEHGPPF